MTDAASAADSLDTGMDLIHVSSDMTAGDLVVGVGTLALASFTWLLARRTSAEVKVSEEQMRLSRKSIELSRASIEAIDQPFLVPQPRSADGAARVYNAFLQLSIANYGKGAAVFESIALFTPDLINLVTTPPDIVRVIPVDRPLEVVEPVDVSVWPAEGTRLNLRITYRSSSGTRYVTDSTVEDTPRHLEFLGHQRKLIPS